MGGGAERWGKGCPKTDLRKNVRRESDELGRLQPGTKRGRGVTGGGPIGSESLAPLSQPVSPAGRRSDSRAPGKGPGASPSAAARVPGRPSTWTGSPRWAAAPPPAGSPGSRSSSSSPWRGAGGGGERLKRPPRLPSERNRGRSAQAETLVKPAPARQGDRKRPCPPSLHRARAAAGRPNKTTGSGRVSPACTAPGLGSPKLEGRGACRRKVVEIRARNEGIRGTRISRKRQGSEGRG